MPGRSSRTSSGANGPLRTSRLAAWWLALALGLGPASWLTAPPAMAQSCPGSGDCCTDNGTPGCQDSQCCAQVCLLDGFCCSSVWDASCATLALTVCGAGACGAAVCPGPGDCCADNGSPACDDVACCDLVCAEDGFCCSTGWDQDCADLAASLCAPGSCSGATCEGLGDCCSENGSGSCEEESCCSLVCDQDSFCCDTLWDEQCAMLASSLCAVCSQPVPVVSDAVRPVLVAMLLVAGAGLVWTRGPSGVVAARVRRILCSTDSFPPDP
jgi:hypothetical protein